MLGAFFDATYYALIKKNLTKINPYILSTGIFLIASIILFTSSYIKGLPAIGPDFYLAVLVTSILNILAVLLYFKALKTTDLSLAIPIISFTPIFLVLTAFLILKEVPTTAGIFGIGLIVLGSYILNIKKEKTNILKPISSLFKNRGSLYMLLVAFLYSLSTNYDKIAIQNSNPIFASAIICLFISMTFFIISLLTSRNELPQIKHHYKIFILAGIIMALAYITINIALSMQVVSYVIAIKRLSILFSIMYGALLFKEQNIKQRSGGALIMLIGFILIILF
jgi:drug/metabolite transporter (DMT)-like permease